MTDQATSDAATAILNQGGSFRQLKRHFSSKEELLAFYGQYCHDKCDLAGTDTCCVCGRQSEYSANFTWGATCKTKAKASSPTALIADIALLLCGMVHIRTASIPVNFSTRHGICDACWRNLRTKRILAGLIEFTGLLAGIICLLVAPLSWAGYFYFHNDSPKSEVTGWLLTAIGATIALALCAVAIVVAKSLRVPPSLRSIPRFPFQYVGVKKVAI